MCVGVVCLCVSEMERYGNQQVRSGGKSDFHSFLQNVSFLEVGEFIFGVVSFQCGEFLQNVMNLVGMVNKIKIHQSAVTRNGYCININRRTSN